MRMLQSSNQDERSSSVGVAAGRPWHLFLALAVLAFLVIRVAGADTIDQAQTAYNEGRFTEAASIAKELNTSKGYTLAARALTIQVHFITKSKKKKQRQLKRAIRYAKAAVKLDRNNARAYLGLARSLGLYSRTLTRLQAARGRYAKQTREAIENALQVAPDSIAARVSMGRWHAGIIARVGSLMAGSMFGAREKQAIAFFDEAIQLSPPSKLTYHAIAAGLIALDSKKYKDKIYDLLQQALELPATDAFGQIVHGEIVKKLSALESSTS